MTPDAAAAQEPSDPAPLINEIPEEEQLRSGLIMLCLAFLVGIFGGFGSVVFKATIAFFHNLFFQGTLSLDYDPNAYLHASKWGAGIILVPVLASFLVTWIVRTFAPEARGHGVPEVLNAIYYRDGHIRPVIVAAKAVVSAISIGTGGSVGREGPIVQVGSAFGSILGQIVRMPTRQRIILIAAGAAAGIAATFNAPIGGLSFAIELLLVSISARTVTLVAVATVTATYIGRIYSGLGPSFDVPKLALFEDHVLRLYALLFCVPLGILTGIAATVFIRSIYMSEDWFLAKFKNDYVRHASGMLVIGLMLYMFFEFTGHYYVGGVGYATVLDAMNGTISNPLFLALLFVAKLLATDITIGSGASGGVFSPSLFLGATLGATFGNAIAWVAPQLGINPAVYTIAAMAAMVGGSTGAVLTAITMTFEQTRDYSIILPIILTVATAHIVRVRLCPESIYTLKLMRRGNHVPQGLQAAVSVRSNAKRIMSTDMNMIEIGQLSQWIEAQSSGNKARYNIIVSEGTVLGCLRNDMIYLLRDEAPDKIIDRNFTLVLPQTRWPVIMRAMRIRNAELAFVTQKSGSVLAEDLIGIITPREISKNAALDAVLMD